MTEWSIDLLGPIRIRGADGEHPAGTPQQRGVLAMLAVRAGEFVPMADLVDGIFGDEPPRSAHTTISTYVTRLRAILDPGRAGVLASATGGYLLDIRPRQVDVHRLTALVAAAAVAVSESRPADALRLYSEGESLWRGEALSGVPGPHAGQQRAVLAERRLSAWESRLAVELDLGEHHSVAAELRGVADAHSFRERLHALRMLALYRSGRQGEALAAYEEIRRLLADELGVDPGRELQEVHATILAAATPLGLPSPLLGPITKPAQLPASVAGFTGRADVFDDLVETLHQTGSDASPTVVAISGMGGVGKTALAVHAAHHVRTLFPDGQIYVDLRGAQAEPVEPGEALTRFITALGVPVGSVPDADAERAALFRSLVADKRMLLILDNARDLAQVRELLPGAASCATLITSRKVLVSLPSASHVALHAMTREEGMRMLGSVLGADRVEAEKLAATDLASACGGLPLALRIAATRLVARPAWGLAAMAERLADERRRIGELRSGDLAVEACFALSYAHVPPLEARAFRLLAVPDAVELPLSACAAVLDLPEHSAEELLESLVDVALLQSPAPGRYRFHDLVKLYARRHEVAEDERSGVNVALADFYIASLRRVMSQVAPADVVYRRYGQRHPIRTAGAAIDVGVEREAIFTVLDHCDPAQLGDLLELIYTTADRYVPVALLRPYVSRLYERDDAYDRARAGYLLGALLLDEGHDAAAEPYLMEVVGGQGPDYVLRLALGELAKRMDSPNQVLAGSSYLGALLGGLGRVEEALESYRATPAYAAELG